VDIFLYPDRLSLIVGLDLIMMGLVVAVYNQDQVVGKLDMKRAIILTKMTGTPVHIKCAGALKRLIIKLYLTVL
jgi:hypothetical protein